MPNLYASTSSAGGTRIGDLPTRLSGWFAHTFSTSSTDLSLPAILAQHSPSRGSQPSSYDSTSSPRKMAAPAALLAVAKHGSGTLNKAMRYLLDSDAVPDRCGDPIWLLGVRHPGWEGPPPDVLSTSTIQQQRKEPRVKARRGSWRSSSSSAASSSADGHSSPPSSTGHASSTLSTPASPAGRTHARAPPDPGAAWPPAFYADFTSRVWLTYRSHLPSPIRDARLADLPPCSPPFALHEEEAYSLPEAGGESRSPTAGRKVWPWAAEKTWNADTGWGCMLRTGQSLLANALVGVQLGRGTLLLFIFLLLKRY